MPFPIIRWTSRKSRPRANYDWIKLQRVSRLFLLCQLIEEVGWIIWVPKGERAVIQFPLDCFNTFRAFRLSSGNIREMVAWMARIGSSWMWGGFVTRLTRPPWRRSRPPGCPGSPKLWQTMIQYWMSISSIVIQGFLLRFSTITGKEIVLNYVWTKLDQQRKNENYQQCLEYYTRFSDKIIRLKDGIWNFLLQTNE